MCECGCIGNAARYRLPANEGNFYLISLLPACTNCDAGTGMTIQLITPENILYREYLRGDFNRGELQLEDGADGPTAFIDCGMRRHEFVQSAMKHLVGIDSREFGDDTTIDECGAEAILEEMYGDVSPQPAVVE